MKKIIAAFVATAALVASTFALDMTASAAVTAPMSFGNFYYDGEKSPDQNTIAIGLEIGADYFFTDLIGVGLDLGFDKVVSMKFDGEKAEDFKNIDFSVFAGCALRVLNDDAMALVVTPGLAFTYDSDSDTKTSVVSFGAGVDAKFGYKVTSNISVDGGLGLVYNFLGTVSNDGEKADKVNFTSFVVTPKIGASYIF